MTSEKSRRKVALSDAAVGFILVAPAIAIFCGIILYPFVNSVLMSFTNRSLLNPDFKLVGLQNYQKVFGDPTFLRTLSNTGVFVLFATLLPFVLGMIWAIILNQKFRGAGFLRGVTLIDWIIHQLSVVLHFRRQSRHCQRAAAQLRSDQPERQFSGAERHRDDGRDHRKDLADAAVVHGIPHGRPAGD